MIRLICAQHPEHHTAQEWQNLWEGSLREIYLKRAGAAPDDSLVSNNASQQSSSTSYDNEPRQPAMVSLPTRPSPMKREASDRTPLRSPSYHPLSPSQRLESTASNGSNGITQDPIGDPVLGSMQEDLFIKTSPKRKRETSEDVVEVPSSSPPGSERPPKRFRRDFSGSQHSDVAPVPEQIVPRSLPREIPDTYPTTIPEGAEVVDLLDAEDSSVYSDEQGEDNEEEYQVEHEEEYEESEEDYKEGDEDEVSRCLSPELGLSSSPPSMDRGRVVSETQAAFQGPTPSIEYELPPPEGGWDDEDEDQEKEGPEIFEIGSDSDENEEEEGDENKEEEGDENEDVGGDELEDEAPKDEVLDQPRAEPRIEVKEDDDGDELEDEAEDNGEEEESEVHTSIPTAQPTTQAIFDAETQFPDLSLPEPEGGWDSVLPSSPSPSQLLSDENIQSQIDMQIFAESQRSSLPPSAPPPQSPPQETTAAMPSPPPPPPSSASKTKAKAPRQKKALTLHSAAEFDECLARNLALGYKEHDILSALKCTSMDPELTRRALGSMAENGGAVEVGMKGFWTEEDDGDLECRDARRVKRVEAKHGTEGVERRWEWLREYRA